MKRLAILVFCLTLIAVMQPVFADEMLNTVVSESVAQIHKNALGDISVSKVYLKRHGIIYIILPDSEKGSEANLIDFQLVRKFPIVATSYLWEFPKQSFLSEKEEVVLVFNHINQVVVSLTNEVLLKYQNGEIPFDELTGLGRLYGPLATVSLDLEEVEESTFIWRQAASFSVEEGKKKMNEYDPNKRTWLGAYPKDKPEYLNRAVPYFDMALRIYPQNKEAPYYKEEISRALLTRSLFNEAKTIYDQFKSDINSEDLNKKNKALFSLYQAYDTLKKATKLNPEHKRANELFEKLSRLLETESRPKRIEEPKTEKVAKEDVKKVEEQKVIKPKELIKTYTEPEGEKPTVFPKPTVEQEKVMPEYSVLNEELYDAPVKTQVTLNVLVSGKISEPGLRALLNQLYSSVKARRGFKYHDSPTNIYIYAFTSKERAGSGMGQWIAMLRKSYGDVKPTISINERQIAQLGAKPEEQFGLSEEKRKEIWKELVLIEDRAMEEALEQYPEEFEKQVEMERRLIDEYQNKLAEKYELTREQLQEISVEGVEKDWPFPK